MNTPPLVAAPARRPQDSAPPVSVEKRKILLVEDHPVTRFGMRLTLEMQPDFVVCGEADTEAAATELLAEAQPDLAIVDIMLKSGCGIALTKTLRASSPALPILVVSMYDEVPFAESAMHAGAMGYLKKQELAEKLVKAIRCILAGDFYLSDAMSNRMLRRMVNKRRVTLGFGIDSLTRREIEVLHLIGNGFSTAEIAARLNLSDKTIDSHREHLKHKLGLSTGADLLQFAIHWTRFDGAAELGMTH